MLKASVVRTIAFMYRSENDMTRSRHLKKSVEYVSGFGWTLIDNDSTGEAKR